MSSSCLRCFKSHKRCSPVRPCDPCLRGGHECVPNVNARPRGRPRKNSSSTSKSPAGKRPAKRRSRSPQKGASLAGPSPGCNGSHHRQRARVSGGFSSPHCQQQEQPQLRSPHLVSEPSMAGLTSPSLALDASQSSPSLSVSSDSSLPGRAKFHSAPATHMYHESIVPLSGRHFINDVWDTNTGTEPSPPLETPTVDILQQHNYEQLLSEIRHLSKLCQQLSEDNTALQRKVLAAPWIMLEAPRFNWPERNVAGLRTWIQSHVLVSCSSAFLHLVERPVEQIVHREIGNVLGMTHLQQTAEAIHEFVGSQVGAVGAMTVQMPDMINHGLRGGRSSVVCIFEWPPNFTLTAVFRYKVYVSMDCEVTVPPASASNGR